MIQNPLARDIQQSQNSNTDVVVDDAKSFPLSLARTGEKLRITAFLTGKGLGRRLSDLGLHVGSVVEVVHRERKGSSIVMHNNSRIALGVGIAKMINVTLDITNAALQCDGCVVSFDQPAEEFDKK